MVNWHPVYGIRPPFSEKEWEEEFNEYKKYPEYK
jgi:cytochrome c oxidase assembly protein subunit 15